MKHLRSIPAMLVFLVILAVAPVWSALHPFFEQNGDCYVLLCTGPYKGVYALNNLTGGAVQKLWDLKDGATNLDAYGIAAHQTWDGTTSQKRLYIFAGIDTGWQNYSGLTSRRVVVDITRNAPLPANPDTYVPTTIVHRYHNPGLPGDSPTGRGNHCAHDYCRSLTAIFGGTCYPCSIVPAATPGQPGFYQIPAGQWYHSLDLPVRSPYTYGQSNYRSPGYWVHYVARENTQVKYRDLKLHRFNRNSGALNGTGFPQSVANVKTGEQATMDLRGECVDGCIRAVDGITLPGAETPYVDCCYSSIAKSYLYRREPSQTTYDLIGRDANSIVVGNPGDLTSTSIGVSSRTSNGDFIYVVGKNVINGWLAAAGAPYTIASLTDFAVSDQWWQTGGIAYAYDRTQRAVYKFVRNDVLSTNPIPEQINVMFDGELPDSIGADGFGHLYMMRTERVPSAPANFVPADAHNYVLSWTAGNGDRYYYAQFRQNVYKTVFRRNYYTRVVSAISGRIPLGVNNWERTFYVRKNDDTNDRTKWNFYGDFVRIGPNVQTDYRVEIAVINSATPPQVEGDPNGYLDARGPLLFNSTTGEFYAATPDGQGKYGDDQVYFFEVENFPRFDSNDVNVWIDKADLDGDGHRGNFVSTIKKSSLQYYWKVVLIEDRSGTVVNLPLLDQEAGGSPGSYRYSAMLSAGKYNVGVKTRFQFYDYRQLLPGAFASEKETVLSGYRTARGNVDADGYSWITFTIKGVPPNANPSGQGVLMSGVNTAHPTFPFRPASPNDPTTTPTFVIPEQPGTLWSFMIRDHKNNHGRAGFDRLLIMDQTVPPIPTGIARMVPNSQNWLARKEFTWTSILVRGTETILQKEVKTLNPWLTAAECATLFPVPSQPQAYTLTCRGGRTGNLKAYYPTTIVDPDGTIRTDWGDAQDCPVPVRIEALANVVVQDQTGPAVSFPNPITAGPPVPGFFSNRGVLYATTGERLADTDYSSATPAPPANPTSLIFVVADNNPMGNMTTGPYASYTDAYHPTLRSNHNHTARFGRFIFTRTFPANITETNDRYRSNPSQAAGTTGTYKIDQKDLTAADFTLSWLPAPDYNRAFSYRQYTLTLTDFIHLSDLSDPTRVPLDYANNAAGYTNPVFGWIAKDSSGFTAANTVANLLAASPMVIRDNDRPNAFIEFWDLKRETERYYLPTNFTDAARTGWKMLAIQPPGADVELKRNTAQDWTTAPTAQVDLTWRTGPLGNLLTSPMSEFEVDVPIFMRPHISDNIGATFVNFQLFDLGGTTVLETKTGPTLSDIRFLFRRPTTSTQRYRIRLEVRDNAKGWPTDINNPVATAGDSFNRRTLEGTFDVYDARLDIRVIDRSNQRQ
jgi:hypothetical protein